MAKAKWSPRSIGWASTGSLTSTFGADFTITEEAQELVNRIAKKTAPLPQITSCSPGWINYMEFFYSDLIPHVSTCKSPHEMQGAITKSYFAKA
jgi:NADP-reducing hydrogenase subunit HndD